MTAHLQQVMNSDEGDSSGEVSLKNTSGSNRISSIMEMDYEDEPKVENEPKTEDKKEHPLNAKAQPQQDDEEDKPKSDKKEESKPKDKKEEPKKEEKPPVEKKKYVYKADGQEVEEELSDEEVNNRLSGSRAIQKRFTELDQQKKQYEKEKAAFDADIQYVKDEFAGIRGSFNSVIDEFNKNGSTKGNPIEPVYNLLDKFGLDIAQFERAVFFHHLPEAAKYLDMDDTGRNAYLLENENKWLKKNQNAAKQREEEAQNYRAKLQEENSLKRQAGISEEEFSQLKDELSNFGVENPDIKQVLEWHKAKPFYDRAKDISGKVPGADVNKVARLLMEFPSTTDEWMLEQLGYKELKGKEVADKLKDKLPPKRTTKVDEEDPEVDEMFKKFRRR